jgi:lysophospholipase L1-like esterase
MQAKNGSAGSGRVRGRLITCVLMLALVAAAVVFPAAANAEEGPPAPAGPIYMALGDSISYGYSAQKFNENFPTESPSRFETGVANDLTKLLRKSVGKNLDLVNLACPGETSNGLIGENPLLGGQVSTEAESPPAPFQGPGDWHPCAYHNADGFPLHAGYGKLSQLEDALSILTEPNKITAKPNEVKLITLNIGNNDVLGLLNQCKFEVTKEFEETGKSKYGPSPEAAVLGCFAGKISSVTIPQVLANVGDTLTQLEAVYSGPIVLFAGYDPLSFVDVGFDKIAVGINEQFEKMIPSKFPHTTIANPFPVFDKGYVPEAKLKEQEMQQKSICKYTEMCNPNVQAPGGKPAGKDGDIHPSAKGYKALAKLADEAYEKNPAK